MNKLWIGIVIGAAFEFAVGREQRVAAAPPAGATAWEYADYTESSGTCAWHTSVGVVQGRSLEEVASKLPGAPKLSKPSSFETLFTLFGADGWELVSQNKAYGDMGIDIWYFKRPIR